MTVGRAYRGFTLIEVLVALVIIAYVGISAQQRIGQFLHERILLQDRQQAHWVAWNQVMTAYQQNLLGVAKGDEKLKERGQEQLLGRRWYFRRQAQDTLSKDLVRQQVSVKPTPFSPISTGAKEADSASLVMFLVK